jgi:hypothetical protein
MSERPVQKPPRELFVRELMSPHPPCAPGQVTTLAVGEEVDGETHR